MPQPTYINLPEEKRSRIESAAVSEFALKPYEAASISDIVRKAGIAKGSFYQYFEDKKDLYRYLIELANAEKVNLVKDLPSPDPDADLFGYFRWLFQAEVVFEIRFPELARILHKAFIEEIPFPEMKEELCRRGPTQFFKQLISQGIVHGTVAPFTDPGLAAFILESIYYQYGQYFMDRLNIDPASTSPETLFDSQEAEALLNNLMDILQTGMQGKPTS